MLFQIQRRDNPGRRCLGGKCQTDSILQVLATTVRSITARVTDRTVLPQSTAGTSVAFLAGSSISAYGDREKRLVRRVRALAGGRGAGTVGHRADL